MSAHRLRTALLCLAFFASGAAALAFETLWFHQATLAFGSGVWASALVLSGFMAGMALGNWLAARIGDGLRRPLSAFAGLELLVLLGGVGLVHLLPALGPLLAPLSTTLESSPLLLGAVRLASAFVLLVVPSTAMGMTLPLAVRGLRRWDPRFGRALGLLYGANTLGAVAGVALVELSLLKLLGVRGSALAAGGLNLLAAAIAWVLAGGARDVSEPQAPPPAERSRAGRRFLVSAALSGFALLALEVVWLRFLVLFLTDTPLAFAMILAVVLLGIAAGGFIASALSARMPRSAEHVDLIALGAGAAGVLGYLAYPAFLQRFLTFDQDAFTVIMVALPLTLPTSLVSGVLFTLLGAALREVRDADADVTGRLTFANTVGAAMGSALGGLLLLPMLGMELSMFALLCLYGVVFAVLTFGRGTPMTPLRWGALAAFVGVMLLYPFGKMERTYVRGSVSRWMTGDDRVLSVREGLTSTLIHVRHGFAGLDLYDQLATNGFSMSTNDFAARRYMKLYAYLPLALHPGMERALVIGYGVGNTTRALVDTPELQRIDVVDTSPGTLALAGDTLQRPPGDSPLQDPRVHVHIEDGRHHLLGTRRRYDLITGEPPPPILAGVENLYGREYFELLRARLRPGGMVTYWLPLMNISAPTARSIIRGFCDAFDDCSLWHGSGKNLMLMGTRDARGPVGLARHIKQWTRPAVRDELTALGFEHPSQLGALFIGDAAYLRRLTRDAEPLTDDWPRRMHQPGTREEMDALLWELRDTQAARKRFEDSPLIARLWPPRVMRDATLQFENQRLLNDLLFPGRTPARQPAVLLQVVQSTPLRLPVLLLMRSDPDLQQALARATPEQLGDPRLRPHLAAGRLLDRDLGAALRLLRQTPDELRPMPGLVEALEHAIYGTPTKNAEDPG